MKAFTGSPEVSFMTVIIYDDAKVKNFMGRFLWHLKVIFFSRGYFCFCEMTAVRAFLQYVLLAPQTFERGLED